MNDFEQRYFAAASNGRSKPADGAPIADLDPIELVFAKLRALLRKAAERSVEALWTRIGKLLDQITSHGCAAYLRRDGYGAR